MTLEDKIRVVLDDDAFDDESMDEGRAGRIESFVHSEDEWKRVQAFFLDVLRDDSAPYGHWLTAAEVFWGAALDHRPLQANRVIGLVYKRLKPDGHSTENNLAWSIASKLKGVSYLSDYDPMADPEILSAMAGLSET